MSVSAIGKMIFDIFASAYKQRFVANLKKKFPALRSTKDQDLISLGFLLAEIRLQHEIVSLEHAKALAVSDLVTNKIKWIKSEIQ